MQKQYVNVNIRVDADGVMQPNRIVWSDGRQWDIARVLHTCTSAHNEFEGIRYTVKIGRAVKYLYRDSQGWYVGKPV